MENDISYNNVSCLEVPAKIVQNNLYTFRTGGFFSIWNAFFRKTLLIQSPSYRIYIGNRFGDKMPSVDKTELDNVSWERAIAQSIKAMCHLYKNLFTDRPHFRVAIFRFPFHCHSQRLKRFATSDRRVLMLPRVRAMRACICHEEIHAIRERMKKRFHGATTQSISLFIFFLFFSSLLPSVPLPYRL